MFGHPHASAVGSVKTEPAEREVGTQEKISKEKTTDRTSIQQVHKEQTDDDDYCYFNWDSGYSDEILLKPPQNPPFLIKNC